MSAPPEVFQRQVKTSGESVLKQFIRIKWESRTQREGKFRPTLRVPSETF
jgi:hypothetical protein